MIRERETGGNADAKHTSHLKNGIGEEKHVVFQRPRHRVRKPNPAKRALLEYENQPRCCIQLRDQLSQRAKNFWSHCCCSVCLLFLMPVLCAFLLFVVKTVSPWQQIPEFQLTALKHALYQTSYLDPVKGEFFGDYSTTVTKQMSELESFMVFNNYTNIERKTNFTTLANGTKVWTKVPSYSPPIDLTGPGNWIPMQCYSNVTYKYASPLIALVEHGTTLEKDLMNQIKSIFYNQEGISSMAEELKKFQDATAASLGKGKSATQEPPKQAEPDPNVFRVPEKLLAIAGGAPPDPHPPVVEKLGRFQFKTFKSKQDLFDYTKKDGYGWDPQTPAVCFGLEVHENVEGNKIELELFFRDQWPKMYATIERLDSDVAPVSSLYNILSYTRAAYNGLNLIQTFAANSILQRKLSPSAEIIMMTRPYKIKVFSASAFVVFLQLFFSFFFMATFAPLAFYLVYSLAKERESGLRQKLFDNGLGRVTHFFSWLICYTVLNLVLTTLYVSLMRPSVFEKDEYLMFYLLVFLAVQSLFSFVWAVQSVASSAKTAVFITAFFFFLSHIVAASIDQPDGAFDLGAKRRAALLPLAAIKITWDCYQKFFQNRFPVGFVNWDTTIQNWSMREGARAFIVNFFLYLAVGLVLEFIMSARSCFNSKFRTRKVFFEDSNMGMIEISGLRAGEAGASLNLKVEKSQICCLIGNDSLQLTQILEMLAGLLPSQGKIIIHDSDFFVRGQQPDLNEFLAYRPANVILDGSLTAIDHLNLFAHLRGRQKHVNTRLLCDKLLPAGIKVNCFSESQRQTLQTLLALASENSRIVLLDEPTKGLDPTQHREFLKMLWSFKKDKYVIIHSSDAELVNVLADQVAKVLPSGLETESSRDVDHHNFGSFRLVVEVEGGKPSDSLVRYLSKDVPDLTLEYHTELLTYYILPNISKALLLQKTCFMENNMDLLGLVDFEVVSLPAFEVEQRNLPKSSPKVLAEGFEESFQEQDYAVSNPSSWQTKVEDVQEFKNNRLRRVSLDGHAEDVTDRDVLEHYCRIETEPKPVQKPTLQENAASTESHHASPEDPEMTEFLKLANEPIKQPAYRRDYYYDFKGLRPKRKFGPLQCPVICRRHLSEHWNNKVRFVALLVLPALFVFLSWLSVRYYRHKSSESQLLIPEWLPAKQPILVNSKTQVGGRDTKKWIENLPNSQASFSPTYVDTTADLNFKGFEEAVYDFSVNKVLDRPWSLGSYQFFEMDETRHKYKVISYVNVTSPWSSALYPQFLIESIMKTALKDDDFEFKVRVSSLPVPKELLDKGNYLQMMELTKMRDLSSMSMVIESVALLSWEAAYGLSTAWFMLNSFFLIQIVGERTSKRKHFLESHGQSSLAYWVARYVHDLLFYVPVTLVTLKMLNTFEPQMELAYKTVFLQPFAMLPFLYVCSHLFDREVIAVLTLLTYHLMVQLLFPLLIVMLRISSNMEPLADAIFRLSKFVPTVGVFNSMIQNKELLWALATFRQNNDQGKGDPVEKDENHSMNGQADIQWMVVHIIVFWFILLVFIEWRFPCVFCKRAKLITVEENEAYFSQLQDQTDEDAESSEVAQIQGDGKDVEIRFVTKQKPRKELAFMFKDFQLLQKRRCCQRKKSDVVVRDLSTQVLSGSKVAIVSEGGHGKTAILETLTERESALKVAGGLKRQIGRRTPVYTSQSHDMLLLDLTLAQNVTFFAGLGSVQPRLAKQMLTAFGLSTRVNVLVRDLEASEKHLTMLILALAGANRTCILDEPFTALSQEQSIKLVKIIRQKYDCTLIVTAKSKAHLEFLQPQQILNIAAGESPQRHDTSNQGFLLAFRLKTLSKEPAGESPVDQSEDAADQINTNPVEPKLDRLSGEELSQLISKNVGVFEKLRGKKQSTVSQVVSKVMQKASLSQEVSEEIGDMVHEDLEMRATSKETALKCELIISLFCLIEAFCKRFGEVHLELRQDDYAVIRVVFNEGQRLKGVDDSFSDQNPVFSSVVEFVSENDTVRKCSTSCHFLSVRNSTTTPGGKQSSGVKIFHYSPNLHKIERFKSNGLSRQASTLSLTSVQAHGRRSSQQRSQENGRLSAQQ